jgi:hypothetical protein
MGVAEPIVSTADQLADVLASGAHGNRLLACLQERFATASRFDFTVGVAMAFSILEADRIGLIHDLTVAESRIAVLERELAKHG